ncbi:MAG: SGNH/GDSL hydrolase family protein [Dietzia sp.]
MTTSPLSRRGLPGTALLLAALLIGVLYPAAPTSWAQAAGVRYVSLGDSYTAGPRYDPVNPCVSHPAAWPRQVAERWGLGGDWADGSCSGAVVDGPEDDVAGTHLAELERRGALGPRTELVTFQYGGNERYGGAFRTAAWSIGMCLADLAGGCDTARDPGAVRVEAITTDELVRRLTRGGSGDMIGRTRALAPNARIALVGYPTVLPRDMSVCVPVVGSASIGIQPRAAYAHAVLDRIEEAQRGAAARLGVDFVSLRAATTGHDLCRPPGERWITQVGDFHEELLPFHPTRTGYSVHAGVVTEYRLR